MMNQRGVLLAILYLLVGPLPVHGQNDPFLFRVTFGHTDTKPSCWAGTIVTQGTSIDEFKGWHLLAQDNISLNTFEICCQVELPKGILLRGTAARAGQMIVKTERGHFSFLVSSFKPGDCEDYLNGAARVERLPYAVKLTDDFRDDDYPSIAVVDKSTAWAVWQSYSGQQDEIRISKYDKSWHTFTRVPGVSGDVWRPQVALDSHHRPWVVWAQQVDSNFDIYGRALDDVRNTWQELVQLSCDPQPDIDHHLISDQEGNLWLVWQGFHEGNSDIYLRHYNGTKWSQEVRITEDPANDWEPRIAVDNQGRAYIVWDTYRSGNYDVYLRSYENEKLGAEIPVADTPRFEAHPSVVVDGRRRVWIAWDESGANWSKDTGATTNPDWRDAARISELWPSPGIRIYESRNLNLAVFEGNQRKTTVHDVQVAASKLGEILDSAPLLVDRRSNPEGDAHDAPQLILDRKSNRIGLVFHRRLWTKTKVDEIPTKAFWETAVMFYEGDTWSPVVGMPQSRGRSSSRPAAEFGPDGSLWLIWPTDERLYTDAHRPVVGNVYTARLELDTCSQSPRFVFQKQTTRFESKPVHPHETADVRAIRQYRTLVHGTQRQIVRGDFHRHTELSWDGGGQTDGSLLDFYRYMLDAAAMDFGAVTDHNAGGDYEYWWWLTEKTCDMYHIQGVFTTFYGYERSAMFPHGHRNVFHTTRGIPVVSFFTETGFEGPRPGVTTGALMENDTRLLYASLHDTGGIAVSHTTGSSDMGTDWRDNDPEVEPVVEIFQGSRVSYEHRGAPRAARGPEDHPPGGFQESGFVWKAYQKGYRLGTIASSDHNSTHMSYAMVYTEEPTREAIFRAIKQRHTYGATDNIILDFRMGDSFMGDEFAAAKVPPLQIKVFGTDRIARVDIIKNEKIAYSATPNQRVVTLTYLDQDSSPGNRHYYVRAIQDDRGIAWSSPIWVNLNP